MLLNYLRSQLHNCNVYTCRACFEGASVFLFYFSSTDPLITGILMKKLKYSGFFCGMTKVTIRVSVK